MNSDGRARRRELVDEAYSLQIKAGMMARGTPIEYSQWILCFAVISSKAIRFLTIMSSYRVRQSMVHSVLAQRYLHTVHGPSSGQSYHSSVIEYSINIHVRRQTLALKGFLVSICQSRLYCKSPRANFNFVVTIYGLVSGADTALLSHEHQQRLVENDLRREARIDLARRGLVATESQIMEWKDERKRSKL